MNDIIEAQPAQPPEPFGYDTEPGSGMILSAVRCRWRSIALVAVIMGALSSAVIWRFVQPKYEVGAIVHVAPVVRPILFSDMDTDISRQYRPYIANEIQAIQSQAVVFAALNTPEVRSLASIVNTPDPAQDIQSRLEVEYVSGTHTMQVSMVGLNAEDMVVIINKLLEKYLNQREAKKRDWDEQILSSLRDAQRDLQTQLETKGIELRQMAADRGVGLGARSGSGDEQWVLELKQKLTETRQRRALRTAQIEALDGSTDADAPSLWNSDGFATFLREDSEWNATSERIGFLKSNALDDERRGRGPEHPDVKGRSERIEMFQEALRIRESELRIAYRDLIRPRLAAEVRDDSVKVKVYEDSLAELAAWQRNNASQAFLLDDLRHERERVEQSLTQVRQKIWNVGVEQSRMSRVTVESPAIAPEKPNKDQRLKYTGMAAAISLMLSIGIALARHLLDTSVREPATVARQLGMLLLGSVEQIQNSNGKGVMCDDRVLEPIRGISTALLASAPKGPSRSRLITSPTAQSGKSSLALKLAQSLASTGRKVLLVDADNRGQGLTQACGMEGCPGLKELFEGTHAPEKVVRTNGAENLNIIPAGQRDALFGEMLGRRCAQDGLRQLFETYDEVIVDSPPVLVGSNAVVLSTLVDEVILILRAGESTREEAQAARDYLATVGDKLVGVILNGVDPKHSTYARYGYEYADHAPGKSD